MTLCVNHVTLHVYVVVTVLEVPASSAGECIGKHTPNTGN